MNGVTEKWIDQECCTASFQNVYIYHESEMYGYSKKHVLNLYNSEFWFWVISFKLFFFHFWHQTFITSVTLSTGFWLKRSLFINAFIWIEQYRCLWIIWLQTDCHSDNYLQYSTWNVTTKWCKHQVWFECFTRVKSTLIMNRYPN